MRILLDECVPRRLRQDLSDHEVRTVTEMAWTSLDNGAILASASGLFDALVTTDQRLSHQQNITKFTIAVVVLVARRTKYEFLRPLAPELRRVLPELRPGEVRRIGV
ncbi:MAG: DUF5615 family PIN-like protein [Elusimicrobia bacterium]|nr:DUF5615 family PIN-like protein [Elusimicrobiota bacterium]